MRVEELLFESDEQQALMESVATRNILKYARRYTGSKKPTIVSLYHPSTPTHHIVFLNDGDKYSRFVYENRKMSEPTTLNRAKSIKQSLTLKIDGWVEEDTRSWLRKNWVPIMGAAVGASLMPLWYFPVIAATVSLSLSEFGGDFVRTALSGTKLGNTMMIGTGGTAGLSAGIAARDIVTASSGN